MSASASRKRKLPSAWDEGESALAAETKKAQTASKSKKQSKEIAANEEKRLRRFREKAPRSFEVIYQRATDQRSRCGTPDCPEEEVEIAGSTGNIYNVRIARVPSCNCPHALNGNQCKHIIYVMCRVLRARPDLVYQLALLTTELREIFEHAPPIEREGSKSRDPNRKQIEGDCPICFTPLEGPDDTVYCRATCGQNIHKECFEMWAATKRRDIRDTVTCPMCRSLWQGDDDMVGKIRNTGVAGSDGYVNVANQLGISGIRDESTYYDGPRARMGASYGFYPRGRYRSWR
ncbi:hypothetical protein F5Y12DRAFT_789262 [Xylaria sp. FL1777]|nr:hypothetical protein F5Y12DRAFT_789262 [Xylaria sp. FL1777]